MERETSMRVFMGSFCTRLIRYLARGMVSVDGMLWFDRSDPAQLSEPSGTSARETQPNRSERSPRPPPVRWANFR
jgi:hypothetical protein